MWVYLTALYYNRLVILFDRREVKPASSFLCIYTQSFTLSPPTHLVCRAPVCLCTCVSPPLVSVYNLSACPSSHPLVRPALLPFSLSLCLCCGLCADFTVPDMFGAFVYILLISLHPFFPTLSVAGWDNSPWFMGCVNGSDSSLLRLCTPRGAHDLDPVTCSKRCLDEG